MARLTTVSAALKKIYAKPNGKEKTINEVINFGVSDTPYAYVSDMKKAKVKFKKSKNAVFGYPNKENMKKLLDYLLKNDGYLSVS
jgi:hypothetical protein